MTLTALKKLKSRKDSSMTPRGFLERISESQAVGWAISPYSNAPKIRITVNDRIVGEGVADLYRSDLETALKSDGKHAFQIVFNDTLNSADALLAKAHVHDNSKWVELPRVSASPPATSNYQDFDGKGASKSHLKLKALKLSDLKKENDHNAPLKGKSVIDLGCNEGFFCVESIKQGARKVTGIDHSKHFIEKAKKRCPQGHFIEGSWWDIPDEKFDVIFFLSAVHYEENQKDLFRKLSYHLNLDGVLVLECGVFQEPGVQAWRTVPRWDGERRYPTHELLINGLLSDYAVRWIGPSVDQVGDPVSRYVYHCTPRRNTAFFLHGKSGSGKTSLSNEFKHHGIYTYHTDRLLESILREKIYESNKFVKNLRSRHTLPEVNFAAIGNEISDLYTKEFCEIIIKELPIELDKFIVEGEILRHSKIRENLTKMLAEKNIRCWSVENETIS